MDSTMAAPKGLKNACKLVRQDLEALPEEAFTRCFGPKVRTVADIVYEVNLVNDHIGMVMREEEPFVWPEGDYIRAPEGFDTKAKILAAFEASSERIVATAEGFSKEEMEAPLEIEEGTTTRAERCRFMTQHLWYHSGQLNFVQTLLGDDGWNWR